MAFLVGDTVRHTHLKRLRYGTVQSIHQNGELIAVQWPGKPEAELCTAGTLRLEESLIRIPTNQ